MSGTNADRGQAVMYIHPSDTVMPSTVVVTPTLDTAVSTASDTTQCKTVSTPDVQTLTTSTETVTGIDKPNMITPTEDQLETHKVTCGPICREKDTAASSESKDVVHDQSRIKADVPPLQTGPQTKDTGGMKGGECNGMKKRQCLQHRIPRQRGSVIACLTPALRLKEINLRGNHREKETNNASG